MSTLPARRVASLDGLRAVAVLAVMANHTGVPLARGGYLGVDVFFVLSGFLITGLLLRERERTGAIGLGRFYLRRVLRLYPALACAVALGLGLVAVGLLPREATLTHAGFALGYLQDLAVSLGWSPTLGPWNHTWSLAIEEHFYLLWPLVLVVLAGRRAWVARVAALLAVLGFAVMQLELVATSSPTAAVYYHPEARSAGLLVGCCLAAAPTLRLPGRLSGWLSGAALAVLLGTMALAPQADGRVAFLVAMPLVWAATCVLLATATRPTAVTRLLSWRGAVYVGAISYGLYLYHPVIAAALAGTGVRRALAAPLAIAVTFAVAALSHRFVERPFLRLKGRFEPAAAPADQAAATPTTGPLVATA